MVEFGDVKLFLIKRCSALGLGLVSVLTMLSLKLARSSLLKTSAARLTHSHAPANFDFKFLPTNTLTPKSKDFKQGGKQKGVTEIRGSYYNPVTHTYLNELLSDWGGMSFYVSVPTLSDKPKRVCGWRQSMEYSLWFKLIFMLSAVRRRCIHPYSTSTSQVSHRHDSFSWNVRLHGRVVEWTYRWNPSSRLIRRSSTWSQCANWCERDNHFVWKQRHELDLQALSWVHTTYLDDDIQASLVSVIQELKPVHAAKLVLTVLSRELDLSAPISVNSIRDRSCGLILRDLGGRLQRRTRSRILHMLMKLLEHIPRDQDAVHIGALDVLWILWSLYLGAGATGEVGGIDFAQPSGQCTSQDCAGPTSHCDCSGWISAGPLRAIRRTEADRVSAPWEKQASLLDPD